MQKIKLSVVMPSFNEEGAVPLMIESIRKNTADYDTEILLVDSSKDRTPEIAAKMGARVVSQPPRGHGIALRTALESASGDIIITSDCDNTYPMEYIPRLVRLVCEEGYDIVSCCRMTKELGKEMPAMNKFGNWMFAFLVRTLYGINVHDVTTGMFCMKKNVVSAVRFETNYSLPCEIITRSVRAGFRHKEIEIPYRLRVGEVTLNRWRSGKAYLKCIFNYRFGLGFSPEQL
ncbi:MAG: glycosyltransferase family 2 protein [Elusimicrobiales bacterium]